MIWKAEVYGHVIGKQLGSTAGIFLLLQAGEEVGVMQRDPVNLQGNRMLLERQ